LYEKLLFSVIVIYVLLCTKLLLLLVYLGLGGSFVVNLLATVPHHQHLSLYIDNYFTSLYLMELLRSRGFNTTGTIRANRLQNCPLLDADKMKKKPEESAFTAVMMLLV